MKKLLIMLSLLVAAACNPEISFPVTVSAEAIIEDGGLVGGVLNQVDFAGLGGIDFNTSQEFQNNDVRRENIRSLTLTSLRLTTLAPEDANFDFIESLQFNAGAPGLADIEIASAEPGDGVQQFDMEIAGVELAPYARGDTFSIDTAGSGRAPEQDTTIKADVTFNVVASLSESGE